MGPPMPFPVSVIDLGVGEKVCAYGHESDFLYNESVSGTETMLKESGAIGAHLG